MVPNSFQRILRGSYRRKLQRGLLFGEAQHRSASPARQQSVQEWIRERNRDVPHERKRNVTHGGELGFARFRWRDGASSGSERFLLRKIRGVGEVYTRFETAAAASRRRAGRTRRFARLPHERICELNFTGPKTVGGCGTGIEYDGRG